MKQRLGGGLLLGFVCVLCVGAAGCGSGDAGTASTENPGTSAAAGVSSPAIPGAGSPATGPTAGSTGQVAAGAAGATSPVSGVAGSVAGASAAAAGASAAAAGSTASSAAAGASASAAGAAASAAGSSAAGGCGSESFVAIYDSIFKNTTYNCSGPLCHGRDAAMATNVGNLSFSSAAVAYMQLVKVTSTGMACMGKTRVVPGDPAGSLLVQKLRGANVMCGGAMPVGGEEITDAELKRITDWISAGACNN